VEYKNNPSIKRNQKSLNFHQRGQKMPTVRVSPRPISYPFHYKSLQRTLMKNSASLLFLINVLSTPLAFLSVLRKKPYFRRILLLTMQRSAQLFLVSALYSSKIHQEIMRKKNKIIYPRDPDWRQKPMLSFFSPCWSVEENENLFEFLFRFRRPEFHNFMGHLGYVDVGSVTGFKRMKVGKGEWYVHMDSAMMIVLRRFAYPCRL
jgi:hypothetical protein